MEDTRESLFFCAKLAFQAEQYEHVVDYMKRLIEILPPTDALTKDERSCFSSACKRVHLRLRKSWFRLRRATFNSSVLCDPRRKKVTADFQELIANKIIQFCSGIVQIIDIHILPPGSGLAATAASADSRVFYMTMKGNYLENQAAVMTGLDREHFVETAQLVYNSAKDDAMNLPVTNLTRLELDLSIALFTADIRRLYNAAFKIADEAVDLATEVFESKGIKPPAEEASVLRHLLCLRNAWHARATMI